jgi:hypothetical protein
MDNVQKGCHFNNTSSSQTFRRLLQLDLCKWMTKKNSLVKNSLYGGVLVTCTQLMLCIQQKMLLLIVVQSRPCHTDIPRSLLPFCYDEMKSHSRDSNSAVCQYLEAQYHTLTFFHTAVLLSAAVHAYIIFYCYTSHFNV